jgi:hypothetical protein
MPLGRTPNRTAGSGARSLCACGQTAEAAGADVVEKAGDAARARLQTVVRSRLANRVAAVGLTVMKSPVGTRGTLGVGVEPGP